MSLMLIISTPFGEFPGEMMRVHLTSDVPVSLRPYRHSALKQEIIKSLIEEMLCQGIIRPSTSPYAAPVTLVLKKDGTYRLVVDFRLLNLIAILEMEPMPIIQDLLDATINSFFYSKLDVKWFFHNFSVHPDDCHKLAIITEDGHFEFIRVPFGFKNSPFFCQRQMRQVFSDMKPVVNFQDDLLLHTPKLPEHVVFVQAVFERLKKFQFRLNHSKCEFLQTKIEFLGHSLSGGLVRPTIYHVMAVTNYPIPKNLKTLQRFLGLVGWLRRFIPDCSLVMRPITDLLKAGVAFQWGQEQQTAFDTIIKIITSRPVLRILDPVLPTEVHTDACATGVAGVLVQMDQPVAYFSQRLSDVESRYTTTELELLAVVRTVEHFRIYLMGIKFFLVTDHMALRWLFKFCESKSRLFRWSESLLQYTFEVQHRPATRLRHVDALSRVQDEEFVGLLVVTVDDIGSYLRQVHEEHGHPGVRATMVAVAKIARWKGMKQATRLYVRSCHCCQMAKHTNCVRSGFLMPIETPMQPMILLAMDTIVLGSAASTTSAKYIQLLIDHHSRFVWARATRFNTTKCALQLLSEVVSLHGPPQYLLTDNGSNLISHVFANFLRKFNIR